MPLLPFYLRCICLDSGEVGAESYTLSSNLEETQFLRVLVGVKWDVLSGQERVNNKEARRSVARRLLQCLLNASVFLRLLSQQSITVSLPLPQLAFKISRCLAAYRCLMSTAATSMAVSVMDQTDRGVPWSEGVNAQWLQASEPFKYLAASSIKPSAASSNSFNNNSTNSTILSQQLVYLTENLLCTFYYHVDFICLKRRQLLDVSAREAIAQVIQSTDDSLPSHSFGNIVVRFIREIVEST